MAIKLKLKTHASAAGVSGVQGVVFNYSGGSIAGSKIGEFTGATFESSLESGEAVLKVLGSAFGGGSLTTSDTPVALVKNATNTTGLITCTVVDE